MLGPLPYLAGTRFVAFVQVEFFLAAALPTPKIVSDNPVSNVVLKSIFGSAPLDA